MVYKNTFNNVHMVGIDSANIYFKQMEELETGAIIFRCWKTVGVLKK